MTYSEFIKSIKFLKDKIILHDGTRISKSIWITSKGFDIDKFNKFLLDKYNEIYNI